MAAATPRTPSPVHLLGQALQRPLLPRLRRCAPWHASAGLRQLLATGPEDSWPAAVLPSFAARAALPERQVHSCLLGRCSDIVSSCPRTFLCTKSMLCCLLLCSLLGRRGTLRGLCCCFLLCSVLSAWIYVLAASVAGSLFLLLPWPRVCLCSLCCLSASHLRRRFVLFLFPTRGASLDLRCSAGDWLYAGKKEAGKTDGDKHFRAHLLRFTRPAVFAQARPKKPLN